MGQMFGKSPALDYLGIDPSERHWVVAVDLAAFRINTIKKAEAAENEARAMKDLPPLPSQFSRQRKPASDTIEIRVNGEKRRVPLPPQNCFYDGQGNLIRPERQTKRTF